MCSTEVTAACSSDRSGWRYVAVFGVATGFAVWGLVGVLRIAGRFIPQPAIEADYLVGLLWALVLGGVILFWPVRTRDKVPLLVIWAAKCAVTLGFMLVYEWNYLLDSYWYFDMSRAASSPVDGLHFGSGTENIIRLAWLHSHFFVSSYHALKVSFAMVGLVGVYLAYRAAARFLGEERPRLLYLLGLFPSILFWSSILGKDPVGVFGMGLYAYGVVSWYQARRKRFATLVVAGMMVSGLIRLWMVPIMAAPLLVFAFFRLRSRGARTILLLLLAAVTWQAAEFVARRLGLSGPGQLYMYVQVFSEGWDGGSAQQPIEFTGIGSMVAFFPLGVVTALFRPLPGEVLNPFGLLAGLENLALIILLLQAVVRARTDRLRHPLVLWAFAVVCTWSSLYAFISYYNFGAAVRFKLQVLPFLLCLLLYLSRSRRSDVTGVQPSVT